MQPECKRLKSYPTLIATRCEKCDERIVGYVHVVDRKFFCATCCGFHSGVNKAAAEAK